MRVTPPARLAVVLLLGGALLTGCVTPPPVPIVLDANGVRPAADYSDLAAVLHRALDKDGLLLCDRVAKVSDRLDHQLKLLAVTGPTASPELFASQADRLAYWYNARAAWAIKIAALNACPKTLPRSALEERAFPLDGRTMSLAAIDRALLGQGDWRVVVAAPGIRKNRSALPGAPFAAGDFPGCVAERLEGFVRDDKRLTIDVPNRQVVVPPVLWQFHAMLIDEYNASYQTQDATFLTALLSHVRGIAAFRIQSVIGYTAVGGPEDAPLCCAKDP